MAGLLSNDELSFFRNLKREWQAKFGDGLEADPPAIAPISQWLEITSTSYTTVNGIKLFPAKPILLWQESGQWDQFDTVWARGPKGSEIFRIGYRMGRMYGSHTDGNPVFVVQPGPCEAIDGVGSGTGTLQSDFCDAGSCGESRFVTYRYYCEPTAVQIQSGMVTNNLNEYEVEVLVNHDSNGCLQATRGNETYIRTVSCCDPRCSLDSPATGTGTGTGGCPCVTQPDTWTVDLTSAFPNAELILCTSFIGSHVMTRVADCLWRKSFSNGGYDFILRLTIGTASVLLEAVYTSGGHETVVASWIKLATVTDCCQSLELFSHQGTYCAQSNSVIVTSSCAADTGTGTGTGTEPGDDPTTTGTGTGTQGGVHSPPCCTDVPKTLTATITDQVSCSCLVGSYTLTYNARLNKWVSALQTLCGQSVYFVLYCALTTPVRWHFNIVCGGVDNDEQMDGGGTCVPFLFVDTGKLLSGTCCNGSVNVTVTS